MSFALGNISVISCINYFITWFQPNVMHECICRLHTSCTLNRINGTFLCEKYNVQRVREMSQAMVVGKCVLVPSRVFIHVTLHDESTVHFRFGVRHEFTCQKSYNCVWNMDGEKSIVREIKRKTQIRTESQKRVMNCGTFWRWKTRFF